MADLQEAVFGVQPLFRNKIVILKYSHPSKHLSKMYTRARITKHTDKNREMARLCTKRNYVHTCVPFFENWKKGHFSKLRWYRFFIGNEVSERKLHLL